jgi:hypothetical protein
MEQEPLPEFHVPKKIRLGYSNIHFRGIFATEDIEAGELIERCPTAIMAWRTNYQKDPVAWEYMYTSSCPCEDCKKHGAIFVMVMGYGQIYNHQDENNAEIKINIKKKTADIVSKRKIMKGEEIFVSYGSKYFNNGRKKITNPPQEQKCEQPNHELQSENVIRPL